MRGLLPAGDHLKRMIRCHSRRADCVALTFSFSESVYKGRKHQQHRVIDRDLPRRGMTGDNGGAGNRVLRETQYLKKAQQQMITKSEEHPGPHQHEAAEHAQDPADEYDRHERQDQQIQKDRIQGKGVKRIHIDRQRHERHRE